MKALLSFTIATAAMVLAVGAPSAFGEGRLAGSPQSDGLAYFRANELATAATSPLPASEAVSYFRANELRTVAKGASAMPAYRDAGQRAVPVSAGTVQGVTATSNDGSSIDWY